MLPMMVPLFGEVVHQLTLGEQTRLLLAHTEGCASIPLREPALV